MEIRSLTEPTTSEDSQSLLQRCCSHDPAVVNRAFQQLGLFLYRVAYAKFSYNSQRAELAHECVQLALAAIWQQLAEGHGPKNVEAFKSWCAKIVVHKVLDALRKERRTPHESYDALVDAGDSSLMQLPDAQVALPDLHAVDSDSARRLVALIREHPDLNDEAKFVLLYGYLCDWDDEALAAALGKERATIRVIRFRSLQLLRNDSDFILELTSMR